MQSFRFTTPIVFSVVLVLAAACSNPATDKPEAQVRESVTAPADVSADAAVGPGSVAARLEAETQPDGARILTLAPESKIEFVGSKVTGKHDGGFRVFDGAVVLVDGDPTRSSVRLVIDMNSVWSDNERLTGHLKTADFFDVESIPTATFQSTGIALAGDGYEVSGDLTLHGVTRNITFPAQITMDSASVSAQAEFFIRRFDFDIRYPGKSDDLIRDEVVIRLNLVAKA